MLYPLLFNITAGQINGTTLVNVPLPAPDTDTGIYTINLASGANMGGIDPDMLQPLIGYGGYLVTGIGGTIMAGPTAFYAGIVMTGGNVLYAVPPFTGRSPTNLPWIDTPFYVPAGFRLFFFAGSDLTTGNASLRVDLLPLRDPELAGQGKSLVAPGLYVPISPLPT